MDVPQQEDDARQCEEEENRGIFGQIMAHGDPLLNPMITLCCHQDDIMSFQPAVNEKDILYICVCVCVCDRCSVLHYAVNHLLCVSYRSK